jgi:hypothetical protein
MQVPLETARTAELLALCRPGGGFDAADVLVALFERGRGATRPADAPARLLANWRSIGVPLALQPSSSACGGLGRLEGGSSASSQACRAGVMPYPSPPCFPAGGPSRAGGEIRGAFESLADLALAGPAPVSASIPPCMSYLAQAARPTLDSCAKPCRYQAPAAAGEPRLRHRRPRRAARSGRDHGLPYGKTLLRAARCRRDRRGRVRTSRRAQAASEPRPGRAVLVVPLSSGACPGDPVANAPVDGPGRSVRWRGRLLRSTSSDALLRRAPRHTAAAVGVAIQPGAARVHVPSDGGSALTRRALPPVRGHAAARPSVPARAYQTWAARVPRLPRRPHDAPGRAPVCSPRQPRGPGRALAASTRILGVIAFPPEAAGPDDGDLRGVTVSYQTRPRRARRLPPSTPAGAAAARAASGSTSAPLTASTTAHRGQRGSTARSLARAT